jgi:hypothetical protein
VIHARRWRTGLSLFGGASLALMMGVLSYAQDSTPRPAPGPLVAQPVPLDAADPDRRRLGRLDYAGGLVLSAGSSSSFSGLSDLVVFASASGDRRTATAITDEGQIARFELILDDQGRLTGADGLTMADLHENGRPLGRAKASGDAEGIAVADGRTFVSLEVDNRVLSMADPFDPSATVVRLALPEPVLTLPKGEGLEALAAAEIDGAPVIALGAETGPVWLCLRRTPDPGACRRILDRPPEALFRLTALTAIPGSADFIALYRTYDPLRGWRARIEHLRSGEGGYHSVNLGRLSAPLTVDNFEGMALEALRDGAGWRLYILSDDNFLSAQRTLLLAFDWRR